MDQLLFAGNETTSPLEGSCFLLSAVSIDLPPLLSFRNVPSQKAKICTPKTTSFCLLLSSSLPRD